MPFGAGECDVNWGPSDAGSATAAPASPSGPTWTYAGLEDVAGRPAHHLACSTGGDLWIDTEMGLIVRTRDAARDAAGEPIKGEFRTNEVTQIEFGDQPASLFDLRPPNGVARVEGPLECSRDLICTKLPPNSDTVAP